MGKYFKVHYIDVTGKPQEVELEPKYWAIVHKVIEKRAYQCAGVPCHRCPFSRWGYECPNTKDEIKIVTDKPSDTEQSSFPVTDLNGETVSKEMVEIRKLQIEVKILKEKYAKIVKVLKSV